MDKTPPKNKVLSEESISSTSYQSEFTDSLLHGLLNKGKLTAADKRDTPEQILWIGSSPIATFGNFSASTGKAKSKKTFNISAMVAAAMTNDLVLNYKATLPEGKRNIIYFDTEQSRYHCHKVRDRILKLSGLPNGSDTNLLTFVGLREYAPSLRIGIIDYALRTHTGCGLVVIDGLRDLMYDINDAKEATDVMTLLMAWTSTYDIHIHCVLHLNKNDNNARGHIGTELENKAETVLVVSKNKYNSSISEVHPVHTREKEFASFAFHIDDDALPVLESNFECSGKKTKSKSLLDLSVEVHKEILGDLFRNNKPKGYEEMVNLLVLSYGLKGYPRGINAIKGLLKKLSEKSIIVQSNHYYSYNPDFDSLSD